AWCCCWFQWGSRLPFGVSARGFRSACQFGQPSSHQRTFMSVKSKGEQRQTPERIFLFHFGTLVTGLARVVAGAHARKRGMGSSGLQRGLYLLASSWVPNL